MIEIIILCCFDGESANQLNLNLYENNLFNVKPLNKMRYVFFFIELPKMATQPKSILHYFQRFWHQIRKRLPFYSAALIQIKTVVWYLLFLQVASYRARTNSKANITYHILSKNYRKLLI